MSTREQWHGEAQYSTGQSSYSLTLGVAVGRFYLYLLTGETVKEMVEGIQTSRGASIVPMISK